MSEALFYQVYGTEMEWPMSSRLNDNANFVQFEAANHSSKFVESYLPDGIVNEGSFLSNGARYYGDVGGKMEYATHEDSLIMGVMIAERAGERIAAEGLRRYMLESDKISEVMMTKRVLDDDQKSWGYHINVLEDRAAIKDIPLDTKAVVAHIATSQAMLGGGSIYRIPNSENYAYSYGQKALVVNHDHRSGTQTTTKPIINLRDEPWSNKEKYWRIHVVGVDPNISDWAGWMSIGTIGLMLAASRQGRTEGLALGGGASEPAAAVARATAKDIGMTNVYEMADGRRLSALDIQELSIEAASNVTGRTSEQDRILEEWQRAHGILKSNPFKLIESDAIAKLALIRGNMARREKTKMDAISREIDLAYTTVFRTTKEEAERSTTDQIAERAPASRVRARGHGGVYITSEQIRDATFNPTARTRAYRRGNAIKNGATSVGWESYVDKNGEPVQMPEPISA